jgi:DNA-binding transcriptional ArsR family regulator
MTSTAERASLRRILERLSDGSLSFDRLSPQEQALILKGLTTTTLAQKTPAEIADETMALLHEVISSRLLIVAEKNPDLARTLFQRVRNSVSHTGVAVLAIADAASSTARQPAEARPIDDVLSGKSSPILKRDYVIFAALREGGNKLVPLKAVVAKVVQIEPGVSENAVTTHLSRLESKGFVERKRKGRYEMTAQGAVYFEKLPAALNEDGEDVPAV